jgi:hypothetical protein
MKTIIITGFILGLADNLPANGINGGPAQYQPADLRNIKSPVIIVAGYREMIREEHCVLIYQKYT